MSKQATTMRDNNSNDFLDENANIEPITFNSLTPRTFGSKQEQKEW